MENFQGKLRGEGPPKRVRIVWTADWVEPGDKWMMGLSLGDGLAAITQRWSPSSTYQQLLTLWWVPLDSVYCWLGGNWC